MHIRGRWGRAFVENPEGRDAARTQDTLLPSVSKHFSYDEYVVVDELNWSNTLFLDNIIMILSEFESARKRIKGAAKLNDCFGLERRRD